MTRLAIALALLLTSITSQAGEVWRLSTRGYGPVHAGMSLSEASRLLGSRLKTSNGRQPNPECDHVYPAGGHQGVGFMVGHGVILHATVSKSNIRTLSGVGVGASSAEVRRIYGSRLIIEPHKYDEGGFYFYVWERDGTHGIKMEIGADRVQAIYAGDTSIQLVEGCS